MESRLTFTLKELSSLREQLKGIPTMQWIMAKKGCHVFFRIFTVAIPFSKVNSLTLT